MLSKLDHYGGSGTAKKWFDLYFVDSKQFLSINVFESNISTVNSDVLQESVFRTLFFRAIKSIPKSPILPMTQVYLILTNH